MGIMTSFEGECKVTLNGCQLLKLEAVFLKWKKVYYSIQFCHESLPEKKKSKCISVLCTDDCRIEKDGLAAHLK